MAGNGLVYNPGERVEGFSSPLWVALLAGLGGLFELVFREPAPLELLNRGLGVVSAAGAVLTTFVFVRRRFALPLVYQWGAASGVLLSWPMLFWSGAGLETPLFAFLVVLTAHRLSDRRACFGRRRVANVVLLAALAMSRPEGPLFVALAGIARLKVSPTDERRGIFVTLAAAATLCAALLGIRLAYYGELLPNTYHAKVGGGALVLLRGGLYLYDYFVRGGGAGLGLLALVGVLSLHSRAARDRRDAPHHLPAIALLLTALLFILLVGGDGLYCFRFVAHVVPLLCAYAALGAHALELQLRSLSRGEPWARWGAGAALGFAVYWGFAPLLRDEKLLYGTPNSLIRESEEVWQLLGRSLRASLPADAVLATNIAGKVPYESRLPTVDMLGLTDAVIAKTPIATMGRGYAGHEKANVDYVSSRRPAVLFISVLERLPIERLRQVDESARVVSFTALRAYAPLLSAASFTRDYVPAQVLLKNGRTWPVFVRRDVAEKTQGTPQLRLFEWAELD